jgi:plasmid maintenance system antidote protein VapI
MGGKPSKPKPVDLDGQLRSAIVESGLSHYQLAKETGISQPIITRFANGDRSISLATASKLATFFGMRLSGPKPPAR